MLIEIKQITIIEAEYGGDDVFLHTNLAPSIWPFEQSPTLKLACAKGTGRKYASDNFPGVPVVIVEA